MPQTKLLQGLTGEVLAFASELSEQGWDVLKFAIDTQPMAESTIVMVEPQCKIQPDHCVYGDYQH